MCNGFIHSLEGNMTLTPAFRATFSSMSINPFYGDATMMDFMWPANGGQFELWSQGLNYPASKPASPEAAALWLLPRSPALASLLQEGEREGWRPRPVG